MSQQLEDRFHLFGKNVRDFCLQVKKDIINVEYIKQLIRSSGSVGANYIEATENLGVADEKMKLKISKKEAKESAHWLDYILTYEDSVMEERRLQLMNEANQIKMILSAIIIKVQNRTNTHQLNP